MPLRIRRATVKDADAIAAVFSSSYRLLTFLPSLHTPAEDRRFIENVILMQSEVLLAEDASGIVSFLALQGEELRLLYTRPDRIGEGAGTRLIEAAMASGVAALELWCFQAKHACASVLRGARGPCRSFHGRCPQRGTDA
jgi:GNAT superfamily N-acetyltransferase